MTSLAAQLLATRIRADHPELRPMARQISNGEWVVRFEKEQYRRIVGWYHLWSHADWYSYLELLDHKSKRKEVAS
jgi:hypothetical protein